MIGFYDYTVILTYLSILSGTTGIILCLNGVGHPYLGMFFLLFSGLCDTFDGKVARSKKDRTEQMKKFGIQIDSLSDLIAFGVLPACIGIAMMTEVAGSEKVLNAELVLIAAGFLGTQKYVADAFGVKLNERTNVAADQENYATSVERVYAAGDVRRGQSLVVWAIREGREVARAVDESLMGYSYLSVQ